jgi:hypothetical protein
MNPTPIPTSTVERKGLAIASLILAFPAPILIMILWATLVDKSDTDIGVKAMQAVFAYVVLLFTGAPASIISVVLGIIAIVKSRKTARVLSIVSLIISGITLILFIAFLVSQAQ